MPMRPLSTLLPLVGAALFGLAAVASGQTHGTNDPGATGAWNLPKSDPAQQKEIEERLGKKRNTVWLIRCSILELEDLGRLYVEDAADRRRYWIQLPSSVKIRAASKGSFGGRKKLQLRDLEVGQRLVVTLRERDDEILRVQVRQPPPPPGAGSESGG